MNKWAGIGRLAADPELRQTGSGIAVTSFTIAVDRPYIKDKAKETDWIDIVAWRNTAEFVCKYFHKGDPIIVEGAIQTRMWEDKSGQKRKSVEIVAENVEFVPKVKGEVIAKNATTTLEPAPMASVYGQGSDEDFVPVDDEDIPF